MTTDTEGQAKGPTIDDFLVEPTRQISDWRWLWEQDQPFPLRSHRGFLGKFIVLFKRLLRPLVKTPQSDLWDRQRVFNLILLEYLEPVLKMEHRLRHLEAFMDEGLKEVMRHNDALFARVDQKLDRYRREARDLSHLLGAALAALESGDPTPLIRAHEEGEYLEFENRFRGTREEIEERIARYLPYLEGRQDIVDLGCGRGEALAVLQRRGIEARGVDSSAEMVRRCQEQGFEAHEGDLFEVLAGQPEESLGGIVSFHVIEHLPISSLDRLVRLAWRALRRQGVLIFETPNPLSVSVAARSFWLDPTHRRPIHPASLKLILRRTGFDEVEQIDLNPFPTEERLPEIDLAALSAADKELADGVNRLRDRLDEMLFGFQDYAVVGIKSG